MTKHLIVAFLFLWITDALIAQNQNSTASDTIVNYIDINGLKQGKWKKNYLNGNPRFEAYFIDDKPIGDFKRFDESGSLYAWLVYDNKGEYASVRFYHKDGKIASTGKYFGKVKDSIWSYYDSNGRLFLQESYKKGVKDGTFKQYTSDGVLIEEINWKNGVKDGLWKKFYVEGPEMWEVSYVNGKLEGPFKSWYKSGSLQKEGNYKNDLEDGDWKMYSESGSLLKTYHFVNGISPEAEADGEQMMKELEQNKDRFDDPAQHLDDPDWLRQQSH